MLSITIRTTYSRLDARTKQIAEKRRVAIAQEPVLGRGRGGVTGLYLLGHGAEMTSPSKREFKENRSELDSVFPAMAHARLG